VCVCVCVDFEMHLDGVERLCQHSLARLLQCFAVCCSVRDCDSNSLSVCCSLLQFVAMVTFCCSVLQCVVM